MGGEEEHGRIIVEGVLRRIPVVVVPVDDEHPLEPMHLLRVPRGHAGVAVVAEPFLGARVVRVVTRRPDRAEGVPYLPRDDRIDRGERPRNGEFRDRARDLDVTDRRDVLRRVERLDVRHRLGGRRERNRGLVQPSRDEFLPNAHEAVGNLRRAPAVGPDQDVVQVARIGEEAGPRRGNGGRAAQAVVRRPRVRGLPAGPGGGRQQAEPRDAQSGLFDELPSRAGEISRRAHGGTPFPETRLIRG